MINIYNKIITHYVNNTLSPNTIKVYASSNNFNITEKESIIIYKFIKNNYQDILNGNDYKLLDLKKLLRKDLYEEIIKLYNYYKKKIE